MASSGCTATEPALKALLANKSTDELKASAPDVSSSIFLHPMHLHDSVHGILAS